MSVSARLEIDWSKHFRISVRKLVILADFWPPEGRYWSDFHEKLIRSGPNAQEC